MAVRPRQARYQAALRPDMTALSILRHTIEFPPAVEMEVCHPSLDSTTHPKYGLAPLRMTILEHRVCVCREREGSAAPHNRP